MDMTVLAETFSQALFALGQVRPSKRDALMLRLAVEGGRFRMQTRHPQMFCTVEWALTDQPGDAVQVNYDALMGITAALGKKNGTWSIQREGEFLKIQNEKLRAWESDDFPAPPSPYAVGDRITEQEEYQQYDPHKITVSYGPRGGHVTRTRPVVYEVLKTEEVYVELDQHTFLQAVQWAATCAATDDSQPHLQSICLDLTAGALSVIGCDAARGCIQKIDVKGAGSWPRRLLVPATGLLRAAQGIPVEKYLTRQVSISAQVLRRRLVERDGHPVRGKDALQEDHVPRVTVSTAGVTYSIETRADTYISLDKLLKLPEPIAVARVSAQKLKAALKALKDVVADVMDKPCFIHLEKNRITLTASNSDEDKRICSFNVTMQGQPTEIGLNLLFVLQAVEQAQGKEVSLRLAGRTEPAVITAQTFDLDAYQVVSPLIVK